MKLNQSKSKAISWMLTVSIALSAMLSSSAVALADDFVYNKYWTTVASAGTVDEADANKLVFQGSAVAFPEILPPLPTNAANADDADTNAQIALPTATTSAMVRYNVTAVDGLFAQGTHVGMTLRFRDDGDWARVQARLYQQDIITGQTTLLLSFDSNSFGASPNYQVAGTNAYLPSWAFNFRQNAYFIEATLTKTSSIFTINGGKPGLAIIQVNRYTPF